MKKKKFFLKKVDDFEDLIDKGLNFPIHSKKSLVNNSWKISTIYDFGNEIKVTFTFDMNKYSVSSKELVSLFKEEKSLSEVLKNKHELLLLLWNYISNEILVLKKNESKNKLVGRGLSRQELNDIKKWFREFLKSAWYSTKENWLYFRKKKLKDPWEGRRVTIKKDTIEYMLSVTTDWFIEKEYSHMSFFHLDDKSIKNISLPFWFELLQR